MMSRSLRAMRIAAHIAEAAFKLNVRAPRWIAAHRRQQTVRWSRQSLSLVGTRLHVRNPEPARMKARGVLYVANHISWLDICALLALCDVCFVAKSGIRGWPIIGRIVAQADTLFVDRDRRAAVRAVNDEIVQRLRAGRSVCVFPESTTTDGSHLLPFRAALFEAATSLGADIQPVAIRHLNANGERLAHAAFVGEMSLARSIWRLLASRGGCTEVDFLPRIRTAGISRREAAQRAERAIADALGVVVVARTDVPPPSTVPHALRGLTPAEASEVDQLVLSAG